MQEKNNSEKIEWNEKYLFYNEINVLFMDLVRIYTASNFLNTILQLLSIENNFNTNCWIFEKKKKNSTLKNQTSVIFTETQLAAVELLMQFTKLIKFYLHYTRSWHTQSIKRLN